MCKFVGKIKQIIPFKGEIEKINSFVGEFIKNYKSPIYDNELPIEWNTVEIKNSSNMLYAYDNTKVKISSYVPTVDELLKMKLTLSYNDDKEVYELVSQASSTNELGHHTVQFKSTEKNILKYLTIVPKGETIPHGLYWESDYYWDNETYENGATYKLYAPVYYDDELPITWNSVQVANAFNTKDGDYVKISNLTPTAEEMETIVITFVLDGETIELPYSLTKEETYMYTNEGATAVVQLRVLSDGLYAGNYGSIDWSGEIWDADFTASIVEEPDIPDTPTGIYDDEWPIEWNSLAVVEAGNATAYDGAIIKISNLTPTDEEMESLVITLIATADGITAELTYTQKQTHDDGVVQYAYVNADVPTVVNLYTIPSDTGLYADNGGSEDMGAMDCDFTLSLAQSGVYDDTWPIEWNSLAVVEAGNVTTEFETVPMIKVSNLTPTADEMQAITLTVHFETESVTAQHFSTNEYNGFVAYSYYESDSGLNLNVCVSDGTVCESGLYVLNVGGEDMGSSNVDISLALPVTATQYLYGREADSVVSYNDITWDGDTTGLTTMSDIYYKVSDAVVTANELLGGKVTVTGNTTIEYTIICVADQEGNYTYWDGIDPEDESTAPENYVFAACQEGFIGLAPPTGGGQYFACILDGSDGSEAGTYFIKYASAYATCLSIPNGYTYTDPDVFIGDVGYVGAVLPNIDEVWDKAKYQYAVMGEQNGGYGIVFSTIEFVYVPQYAMVGNMNNCDFALYYCQDGEWTLGTSEENANSGSGTVPNAMWSSYDIKNADDGSFYLEATDPIPVSSIVGYSYNGTVLPELPERDTTVYPNADIYFYEDSYYCYFMPTHSTRCVNDELYADYWGSNTETLLPRYVYKDGVWNENSSLWVRGTIVWSSIDMPYSEDSTHAGEVAMVASDPIPVYE